MPEMQFDGLVGPTHNYAGLSPGNVASATHAGRTSDPRGAARQGLAKMRFVRELGVGQAVLPPHDRPSLPALHRLGFHGSDEDVIAAAAAGDGWALRACSSASPMWAANAATVAPSSDTLDRRVHVTPANLQSMFHRSLEAPLTTRILRAVFADPARFVVHDPLPGGGQLSDEGAANHTRLETSRGVVHAFAWGRRAWGDFDAPRRHPARQSFEASAALARLHRLDPARVSAVFPQQHPAGIDAGGFHTDVLAVGNGGFFMLHDLAFADESFAAGLEARLGPGLVVVRASNRELPVESAVAAYPFNSQVLSLPGGAMAVIAPLDAQEDRASHAFLTRVAATAPVTAVHYIDVRQSMRNGGGPACLRLRVPLTAEETAALGARVVFDEVLEGALGAWVERHYRDRLSPADLADPALAREGLRALDELTRILDLGPVYDFQRVSTIHRQEHP
jgi:succinylarginine dihydrolase